MDYVRKGLLRHKSLAVVAVLAVVLVIAAISVKGHRSSSSSVPDNSKQLKTVQSLDDKLTPLVSSYHAAKDEATKARLLNQAEGVAKERHQAMLHLIKTDPAVAVKAAISPAARSQLPDKIKPFFEKDVKTQGRLVTIHADGKTDRDSHYYFYLDTAHERIALHQPKPDDPALIRKTKAQVRVSGVQLDNHMALASSGSVQLASFTPSTIGAPGVKKVAVLMFNFSNNTPSEAQPLTADQARSRVFTTSDSVNDFYQKATFGKYSLTGKLRADGDVFGWYTIANTDDTCDPDSWTPAVKTAAQNAGVDLSGYDDIIMLFPYTSTCYWSGLAEVSGSNVWINGAVNFTDHPIAHELGHNYGLMHAATKDCTDSNGQRVMISSTCTVSEYGDFFDPMGNLALFHFNNFNKGRLGLYAPSNTQTVTASGTYTVLPEDKATAGVVALRVPAGDRFYYLEDRTTTDDYDFFAPADPVVNGVSIRLAPDYNQLDYTYVLDGTPTNTSPSDRALPVNKTFTDSDLGITVKVLSASSSGASVQITLANPIAADTTAPSAPTGLSGVSGTFADTGEPFVQLSWTASTDNVGVTGYDVYRNGSLITGNAGYFLSDTSFVDTGVTYGTTYQYYVKARDAAGNISLQSNTLNRTTPSSGPTTDTTPPTVSWLNPFDGNTISGLLDENSCRVNATDTFGVDHVNFYLDDNLINTDTDYPWTCLLDTATVSNGSHILKATAVDVTGNSASASLNVTVSNSGACPIGDINDDCHVNVTDLSNLLSNYFSSNADCDLNNDGTVNIYDLSILLGNFGK